jgi:hypothetical protein
MKKFVSGLLLFSLFAGIVYICALCLWGNYAPSLFKSNLNYKRYSYGHMYTRIRDIRNYRDVDVLFLGSSHAYRGFDTRIFDSASVRSFNLGSSSQTPMQTQILLDKYLDQLNPRIVVFEVSPLIFANDGVESSLDLLANDEIDRSTLDLVLGVNHLKTYNAFIYALYCELTGKYDAQHEDQQKEDDRYITGGYVEKTLYFYSHEPPLAEKVPWILEDAQVEALRNMLATLRKRGIPYLLVQAPVTRSSYLSHSNNEAMDSLFSAEGEYMNFNGAIALDDSLDFYDSHHLNQNGVIKFNHAFLDSLFPRLISR